MPTRSKESERFWRMADNVIFSAPEQNTVWDLAGRMGSDEKARRRWLYSATFGVDSTAVNSQAQGQAPNGANREFIENWEAFGREVWRGYVNRNNTAGENDANYEAIVSHANSLRDTLRTRRQRGSLSVEEFRAVAVMSMLHLAVRFNSWVVKDFNAAADEPADRLERMGLQVGVAANPNARALFEIAPDFSTLLQMIETNEVSNSIQAERLCTVRPYCDLAARVIHHHRQAMGRDLTAQKTEFLAFPANPRVRQRVLALGAPQGP
jgi:hypothetical protein